MATINARLKIRSGTTAQWAAADPVLLTGEMAYDVDLKQIRIGDGVTNYLSLPFAPLSTLTYLPDDLTLPALNMTRVKPDATGVEFRTPQEVRESDLGISGPGGTIAETITNLDTHAKGGTFYAASTATGLPLAEASIVIHLPADANARSVQEAISLTTGRRWMRVETASVWGAWVEMQRVNPATLTTQGTSNNGFAGGVIARNDGYGTAGVAFDANIRGAIVGGMQVQDTGAWGTALRLLANATGTVDGDRRFVGLEIASNGNITVFNPSQLAGHLNAAVSVGGVGTYAFLARNGNSSTIVAGQTYAGSALVYAGISAANAYNYNTALDAGGSALAGTWRAMGSCVVGPDSSRGTLFLRIS